MTLDPFADRTSLLDYRKLLKRDVDQTVCYLRPVLVIIAYGRPAQVENRSGVLIHCFGLRLTLGVDIVEADLCPLAEY